MIELWAIRRAADGHYLPNLPRGARAGATYLEPVEPDEDHPPRLFRSAFAARIALTAWTKGRYHVTPSDYIGFGEYSDEHLEIVPVPGRRAEDMEVVPVRLRLPPPTKQGEMQ